MHTCTFLLQNGALWDTELVLCGINSTGLLQDLWCSVPYPDSKVHGANMGPTCVLSAPDITTTVGNSFSLTMMPWRQIIIHDIFLNQISEFCNNFPSISEHRDLSIANQASNNWHGIIIIHEGPHDLYDMAEISTGNTNDREWISSRWNFNDDKLFCDSQLFKTKCF